MSHTPGFYERELTRTSWAVEDIAARWGTTPEALATLQEMTLDELRRYYADTHTRLRRLGRRLDWIAARDPEEAERVLRTWATEIDELMTLIQREAH